MSRNKDVERERSISMRIFILLIYRGLRFSSAFFLLFIWFGMQKVVILQSQFGRELTEFGNWRDG